MRYTPKTKPFPHQSKAVVKSLRARNFALFLEPRTGKTKVAIDYVGALSLKGEVSRVLVLCPLIAIDVWISELRKHAPYPYEWETYDSTFSSTPGGASTTIQLAKKSVRFYLLNYEKLSYRHRTRGAYKYPYVEEMERFNPDVVVCDESHRLKRAGGVGAQAAWRMVRRLRAHTSESGRKPYVLLLTGTPQEKGWIDLFAQFRIMDDSILGTSKADFEEDYCVYGRGHRKYTIVKYRHEKQLLEKIRAHSYSVTSEDVGLAGKQFTQHLWYDLPTAARNIYHDMAEEFLAELGDGQTLAASNPGTKRLRLLQIAGGYTTDGSEIHTAGVGILSELLRDLRHQQQKVVVYARFLAELDAIEEAATRIKYPVRILSGQVARQDRRRSLDSFQQSRTPQVLLCQVQVGSLAIELSSASEAIFYSLPDSWIQYRQCRDRLGGPNQKSAVRYTHILARATLHPSVLRSLHRKRDWHRELLSNPREFLYGRSTDL